MTVDEHEMAIERILREARERYTAMGLDYRCPTCGAGAGKFCLKPGVKVHRSADDIAIHPERVALVG